MDKKDIVRAVAWIVGALLWAVIACDNIAQSNTTCAVTQAALSVCFIINAVRCYITVKSKQNCDPRGSLFCLYSLQLSKKQV